MKGNGVIWWNIILLSFHSDFCSLLISWWTR